MSTSCIKKLETKKIISLRRPYSPNSIKEKTLDILTQKEQQEQSEGKEGIEIMEKHKQRQRKIKEDHTGNMKTPTLFWKRSVPIEYRDTLIQK